MPFLSYCESVADFETVEYALESLDVVDVLANAVDKVRHIDQAREQPRERCIHIRPAYGEQCVVLARIQNAHISEREKNKTKMWKILHIECC